MRNKIFLSVVFALMVSLPFAAQADKDFIQKLQNIAKTVQEKGKSYQEQIQEYKDKFKSASEGVAGAAAEVQSGVQAAQNGDVDSLKQFGKRVEGLPSEANADKDEMAEAIQEKYVPKVGEGNDEENNEKAEAFIQEVMRNAVSKLYALGFTTRTLMQKEEPRDVDMSDNRQMMQETNYKAIEMIERLTQIFILESALEEYQYTQSIKTMTIDVSAQEDEEE